MFSWGSAKAMPRSPKARWIAMCRSSLVFSPCPKSTKHRELQCVVAEVEQQGLRRRVVDHAFVLSRDLEKSLLHQLDVGAAGHAERNVDAAS